MATFGKETPLDRPDPGGRAAVFVPHPESDPVLGAALRNGSGMVGFGNPDGSVTVYFENNKFGDSALFPWQGKVFKAYDRMVKRFPTVNKLTCDAGELVQVGIVQDGEVTVRDMEALSAWLERSGAPDSAPEGGAVIA